MLLVIIIIIVLFIYLLLYILFPALASLFLSRKKRLCRKVVEDKNAILLLKAVTHFHVGNSQCFPFCLGITLLQAYVLLTINTLALFNVELPVFETCRDCFINLLCTTRLGYKAVMFTIMRWHQNIFQVFHVFCILWTSAWSYINLQFFFLWYIVLK